MEIEKHLENVRAYREKFKGKSKYEVVPVEASVYIVQLIQEKVISKKTGLFLLDYYSCLHRIRMGEESEADVRWLIEILDKNESSVRDTTTHRDAAD